MDTPRENAALAAAHISWAFLLSYVASILTLQPWPEGTALASALATGIGVLCCPWIRSRAGALGLAAMAGVLCAALSVTHARLHPDPILSAIPGKTDIAVRGTIAGPPARNGLEVRFPLEIEALGIDGTARPAHGTLLASADRFAAADLRVGDLIAAQGELERPEDGGYARYLAASGITGTVRIRRSDLLVRPPGNPHAFLARLRGAVEARVRSLLPEPHAAFLTGLLTGGSAGMPKRLTAALKTAGLTHITAISGSNITIILAALGGLLFWLPLRWRTVPLCLGVAVFVVFVGAGASAVRAGIMGILGVFALHLGRVRDVRLAVAWSGALMLAYNPAYLRDDAGFQLSFLAVIGIMELQKPLRALLGNLPLADALSTTLAAQLSTGPWIAFAFGQASLISPAANLAAAPLITPAMALGALTLLASLLSRTLGLLLAMLTWLCLECILRIAVFFASVPYAAVETAPPGWLIAGMYAAMAGGVMAYRFRLTTHTNTPTTSSPIAPPAWSLSAPAPAAGTRATRSVSPA